MIVSIVLDKPLGDTAEGTVIQVEQDVADALVAAGIAHEATADDLGAAGTDETAAADPTVQLALEDKVTKAAEKAVEKAVELAQQQTKAPNLTARYESADPAGTKGGFGRFGDYLVCEIARQEGDPSAVQKMHRYGQARQKAQMTVGAFAAGGSLVPQEWASELFRLAFDKVPNLLEMMTRYPMQHQTLNLPAIVQASAATGVVANTVAEAAAIPDTTAVTANVQLTLRKNAVLVNVTDELMRFNGYALESVFKQYVPERIRYKVNDDIVTGSNGGVNLVGNAARVLVQRAVANRISFDDVNKMDASLYDAYGDNYVWLTNRSTMPELRRLAFPSTSGNFPIPVFLPGGDPFGGMTAKPAGTLLGQPIYTVENVPALGSVGDLMAVHLPSISSGYLDLDSGFTPFLYWDKAIGSFRFLLYAASVNPLTSAYTRKDGSVASNIVVLGAPAA